MFKFLEHTADIGIEAEAKNLEKVFADIALGMFEVMTSTKKIKRKIKKEIKIESEDLQALLYDFLEKFLILHDTENLMFSKFDVKKIQKEKDKWNLECEAWGEEFDPKKHEDRTLVKAVTYHEMKIEKTSKGWKAKVIVDI
jgi:SHS2 domain-containing protein